MGNRLLGLKSLHRKKIISEFHDAGKFEFTQTRFNFQTNETRKHFHTPAVQKIPPDLEFLEYLETCNQTNTGNVFLKSCTHENLEEIMLNFITQAFTTEEFKELEIEKNVICEPNQFCDFHGSIDFLLHNPKNNKILAILLPKKKDLCGNDSKFFGLGEYSSETVFEYLLSNLKDETQLSVIVSDCHFWQMSSLGEMGAILKTQPIKGYDGLVFLDIDVIRYALGLIRYSLLRFENELLYDQFLELYDQKKLSARKIQ